MSLMEADPALIDAELAFIDPIYADVFTEDEKAAIASMRKWDDIMAEYSQQQSFEVTPSPEHLALASSVECELPH